MTKISSGFKNVRLPNYDYRNGWFFVTNQTNFSRPYIKSEYYQIVKDELFELPKKYSGVKIDFFSLMPTHIHVIMIFDDAPYPLSEIWRRFKSVTTLYAKRAGLLDVTLWQENLYEHIIRNDKAVERIRLYIVNNPLKVHLPLDEIYESPKDYALIIN